MEKDLTWLHQMGAARRGTIGGFLGLLVLALVAAGCASYGTAPAAQPAAPAAAQPTAAAVQPAAGPATSELPTPELLPATGMTPAAAAGGGALVNLAQRDNFGRFLVDDKGMTLYLYTKDTPNTSNCYDQCATNWPPLYTDGAPMAGTGVTASLLSTTTRKDGKMQVTYNGNPLYYFIKDQKAGDIAGQGVGGVWFVVSPRGSGMTSAKAPGQGTAAPQSQATPAAAAPATAAPAEGGYGTNAGGGNSQAAATSAPAAGQTMSVGMKGMTFAPQTLTVAAGTTVEWKNDDSLAHTVTADNGSFDSGNLAPGATFKFTFTKAGTYPYYCRYHGSPGGSGMAGQVVVQ